MWQLLKKLINFIDRDIWRIHTKKLSRRESFFIKQLRVVILALREFRDNKCQLSASALTFYTLLSIVPVFAMAFGIAKGFGFDQKLEQELLTKFPGQEQTTQQVIGFANNLLKDAQGGLIAGIGVIVLFWTVVKVLNSIEESFNDIWGVKVGRSVGRKVNDYLSIMLICPFFMVASGAVTVFISTQVHFILTHLSFLGSFSSSLLLSLHILPYVIVWALFTFIYIFMPNTKVRFSSGLIGGIIAGTIYQIVQIVYIKFQIGVANSNLIYGSFSALPLFLIWLQMSWRILLFGAEVSFAHQNVDTYEFEQDCLNVSHAFRRLLALHITTVLVKRFTTGQTPLNAIQISDSLDIPIRLVQALLFELTRVGILTEIKEATHKQSTYQPARDIHQLTIYFVINALDKQKTGDIPPTDSLELTHLQESLKEFEDLIRLSPKNILLQDI
ncbi:MAG: YihY family inner membrane protein [Candidatus Omnitrophica bacterium]|nr:YihY family inner membrane protein [Candidatus Omnitrophota bacterium]